MHQKKSLYYTFCKFKNSTLPWCKKKTIYLYQVCPEKPLAQITSKPGRKCAVDTFIDLGQRYYVKK